MVLLSFPYAPFQGWGGWVVGEFGFFCLFSVPTLYPLALHVPIPRAIDFSARFQINELEFFALRRLIKAHLLVKKLFD